MYTNYLQTFRTLIHSNFYIQRKITDQELTFTNRYVATNPAEKLLQQSFSPLETPSLNGFNHYVLKYLLCALTERDLHEDDFQSYDAFHLWVSDLLSQVTQMELSELIQLNTLFDYTDVETFARRFGSYVGQLAQEVYKGVQKPSETHLMALKITLLHVKLQVERGSSEELDYFLFFRHYRESTLDLEFIAGTTDVISNRLSTFKKAYRKEV